MTTQQDIDALDASAIRLWTDGRWNEAAELYDVLGDIYEERGDSRFVIQGARGAARRMRVTAWARERWPERQHPHDRQFYPDYWIGKTRQVWAIRYTIGSVWRMEHVTIDRRGKVRLATDKERRRSRYQW